MRPTILLYNIMDKTRLLKIYQALLPLGFRIRLVDQSEFALPIGQLAGMDSGNAQENTAELPAEIAESASVSCTQEERETFSAEMAVMAGFTSAQVDAFILALRKKGVGRIDYKAVLTPTNRTWDSVKLYQELKKEHERMHVGEQREG